jgi:hypothetical protein
LTCDLSFRNGERKHKFFHCTTNGLARSHHLGFNPGRKEILPARSLVIWRTSSFASLTVPAQFSSIMSSSAIQVRLSEETTNDWIGYLQRRPATGRTVYFAR